MGERPRNIGELALRAAKGDKEALKELLDDAYFRWRLKKICKFIAGRRKARGFFIEPEDLEQEAYKKICEKIDKFEGKSSFETWVSRLLDNLLIDMHRQKIIYDNHIRGLGDLDSRADLEEKMIYQIRLKEAISKLSEDQKNILRLVIEEGYKRTEISQMLGIPLAKVYREWEIILKLLADM